MFIVESFSKSSDVLNMTRTSEVVYVDVLDTKDLSVERHTLSDIYNNYRDVKIYGLDIKGIFRPYESRKGLLYWSINKAYSLNECCCCLIYDNKVYFQVDDSDLCFKEDTMLSDISNNDLRLLMSKYHIDIQIINEKAFFNLVNTIESFMLDKAKLKITFGYAPVTFIKLDVVSAFFDDNNAYVDLFSFGTAPSSGVDYNKMCEILSNKLGYNVCYALQRTGFGDLQTRLVLGVSRDTFRKEFLKPLVI